MHIRIVILFWFLPFTLSAQFTEVWRHKSNGSISDDLSASIYFSVLRSDTAAYITVNNRFYWTELTLFQKHTNDLWYKPTDPLRVRKVRMNLSSFMVKDTLYNLQHYGYGDEDDSIVLMKFSGSGWIPASKKIDNITEFLNADLVCEKDTFYTVYRIENTVYIQKLVGMEWKTIASFEDDTYWNKLRLMVDGNTFYVSSQIYGSRKLKIRKITKGVITDLEFPGDAVHEGSEVVMKKYNNELFVGYVRGNDIYDHYFQLWSYDGSAWKKSSAFMYFATADSFMYSFEFMNKDGKLFLVYPTSSSFNKATITTLQYDESLKEWGNSTSGTLAMDYDYDLRTIRVLDDQIFFSIGNDYNKNELIIYGYEEIGATKDSTVNQCQGEDIKLILTGLHKEDEITWIKDKSVLTESINVAGVNNDTLKLFNLSSSSEGNYQAIIKRKYTFYQMEDTTSAYVVNVYNPGIGVNNVSNRLFDCEKAFDVYIPLLNIKKSADWFRNGTLAFTDLYNEAYTFYGKNKITDEDTGTYLVKLYDFCGNQFLTNEFSIKYKSDCIKSSIADPAGAKESNLIVYPNPAKEIFRIMHNKEKINTIKMINSQGVVIQTISNYLGEEIPINKYAKGLYLIEMVSDAGLRELQYLVVE